MTCCSFLPRLESEGVGQRVVERQHVGHETIHVLFSIYMLYDVVYSMLYSMLYPRLYSMLYDVLYGMR